jgi:hypothetical protein
LQKIEAIIDIESSILSYFAVLSDLIEEIEKEG